MVQPDLQSHEGNRPCRSNHFRSEASSRASSATRNDVILPFSRCWRRARRSHRRVQVEPRQHVGTVDEDLLKRKGPGRHLALA